MKSTDDYLLMRKKCLGNYLDNCTKMQRLPCQRPINSSLATFIRVKNSSNLRVFFMQLTAIRNNFVFLIVLSAVAHFLIFFN